MFLVVEKMGAAAVDEEEDEVALVFWRLGGGDVAALLVPVVVFSLVDIFWKRGFGRGFIFQDSTFDGIADKEERDAMNTWIHVCREEIG